MFRGTHFAVLGRLTSIDFLSYITKCSFFAVSYWKLWKCNWPNPPLFSPLSWETFFFFLHCNCLHLRHTEKSSCWGGWKALQKRLESPAGPWILWQRMREAIQNCSQAAVAASTPMLLLYFMQAQISCATVILRLALSVWLPFLSQDSSQWAQKLNPFIDTSISLLCYIRWQHDSFWMSQTNWQTKQLLIKGRYITFK